MADIVIRGMKMPKTCVQCDLKIYDPEKRWNENGIKQIGAWVCKRTREIIWNTQRGENCPLTPLPEGHGDLIEKKSAKAKFCQFCFWKHQNEDACERCAGCPIDFLTTIVPAEGGGEDGN